MFSVSIFGHLALDPACLYYYYYYYYYYFVYILWSFHLPLISVSECCLLLLLTAWLLIRRV